MADLATLHFFVVVDIEKFGSRDDPVQEHLRAALYGVLERAARACGLPWPELAREDRGDGVLLVVPPTVSRITLTEGLIRRLQVELTGYARVASPAAVMRLRVALHAGEARRDGHGWVGTSVNTAFRLVDAPPLKAALAAATGARLALIVSDDWYEAVVRHDHDGIDHRAYWRVPVAAKELRTWAWVHVPGTGSPAPEPDDRPAQDQRPAPGSRTAPEAPVAPEALVAPEAPAGRDERPVPETPVPHVQTGRGGIFAFGTMTVHGDAVAGDKSVHGDAP